jgi:hypothetical protein
MKSPYQSLPFLTVHCAYPALIQPLPLLVPQSIGLTQQGLHLNVTQTVSLPQGWIQEIKRM